MYRCTVRRWLLLLAVAALSANLYVICKIFSEGPPEVCSDYLHSQKQSRGGAVVTLPEESSGVVFVIRDFEEFENDVVATALNLSSSHAKVVIVADQVPYPPLKLPASSAIHLVSTDLQISEPLANSRPEYHIHASQYVILVPDAVRLSANLKYMIDFLEQSSKNNPSIAIAAFPIKKLGTTAKSALKCLSLKVDLKHWMLNYSLEKSSQICDALDGDSYALIMKKDTLLNFSSPFLRPAKVSLFIQSVFHGFKIVVNSQTLPFFYSTTLFETNAHNRWKHKQMELQRQRNVYSKLGIKLVRQVDGRENWYGCGKETGRCFGTVVGDMPDYIYHGRWTPPCCLRALRETARHVFRILESERVRYWLEGGSLLGAARNGDIIPWDYDVDIGIYRDDISHSEYLSHCRSSSEAVVDRDGFIWEKATEGDFYRVQYSQSNHLHVDIFPFYSRNGTMTKDTWFKMHKQDTEFPESFIQPLGQVNFAGTNASAPNDIRTFLEYKFGIGVIESPRLPNSDVVTGVT